MTNLNANELTILKAALDNAQDAAGGDFGFSDEIHGYVKDQFSQEQVAGYISQLNDKGLMWLDHCETDTFNGNQTTFPRVTLQVMLKAGLIDEAYAEDFQCWYDTDNNNGDVDTFEVPAPAEEKKETMTYGQVNRARRAAEDAEEEAMSWLNIAKMSCGTELFDARTEQYREAAQRAIVARLAWLETRNDFESGK